MTAARYRRSAQCASATYCFWTASKPELDFHSLGIGAKYGKCGVSGPFHQRFGRELRFYNEMGSVVAEIFHQHGYFTPERLVPDEAWPKLVEAADAAYVDTDVHMSEILDAFEPPSLKIGRDLLCYAPENDTGWLFIDCFWETTTTYEAGTSGLEHSTETYDPLVRDFRLPGADFEENLRLTLYGRFSTGGQAGGSTTPTAGNRLKGRPSPLNFAQSSPRTRHSRLPCSAATSHSGMHTQAGA
ncbi:hypothetical protein [Glycomyces tarimensis]